MKVIAFKFVRARKDGPAAAFLWAGRTQTITSAACSRLERKSGQKALPNMVQAGVGGFSLQGFKKCV